MSFHNRGHMLKRPIHYGEEDNAEALHTQAILASYGWLLPQACYQGKQSNLHINKHARHKFSNQSSESILTNNEKDMCNRVADLERLEDTWFSCLNLQDMDPH